MKPEGYPLPWNDVLGEPYWKTNLRWCLGIEHWAEWQSGKPMSSLIPAIDRILNQSRARGESR